MLIFLGVVTYAKLAIQHTPYMQLEHLEDRTQVCSHVTREFLKSFEQLYYYTHVNMDKGYGAQEIPNYPYSDWYLVSQ